MLKNEWRFIGHNRLILLSVIVMTLIPLLYSVFFLKSVWDPYGETQALPVAVVNQDQPVKYNGETLNVGKQTVQKLKNNKQLGWRFVSAKQAKQGLKDKKYYTVITLPKNFSANATTALNKNPKKMQLSYKTNGSLNYIGEVISEIGATSLDKEIRAAVTNAYASAMFDQLHVVGKGMTTAAKGATQLDNGLVTLNDGLGQYTVAVSQVNDGVQTLKVSVKPLASGVQQLATGAMQLQANSAALNSGAQQVANGTQTLNSKVGPLASGVDQLTVGSGSLVNGLGQYITGVGSLNTGLNTLADSSTQVTGGVQQLVAGTKELPLAAAGIYAYNSTISQNLSKIQTELQQTDLSQVSNQVSQMQSVNEQSQAVADQMSTLEDSLPVLQGLSSTLTELSASQQTITNVQDQIDGLAGLQSQLKTSLTNSATTDGQIAESSTTTAQQLKGIDQSKLSDADKTILETAIDTNSANAKSAEANVKVTTDVGTQLNTALDGLDLSQINKLMKAMPNAETITTTQQIMNDLPAMITSAKSLLKTSSSMTNSDTQAQLNGLVTKLGELTDGIQQLSAASNTVTGYANELNSKVNGSGVNTSSEAKIAATIGNSTMLTQINQLSGGLQQYVGGVNTAAAGSNQLAANSSTLNSGAIQLNSGLLTLNSSIPTLSNGVSQLASGSSQVASGVSQYTAGTDTLGNGILTLNAQIPTLTAGVDQLADGTSQLNSKSAELMAGGNKLNDGSNTLATALTAGGKQVNGIQTTAKTADMFASPTKLTHKDYSYVPNYGHALAPYVLSLALYVGAIVFNFAYPIRRISTKGQSATAWFFSKVSVGGAVAIMMAVIEASLMLLFGLSVDHVGQFYLMAITFALASMFLVMLLSMAFDNPGRFVAMVLLMLQLGGSGGTFPMEVTNSFYNAIHPYLPMTYSILGFRQAITSGLGNGQTWSAFATLAGILVVSLLLLWWIMQILQRIHLNGVSQLDENQKLQKLEQ
ncbi:YhgE/Pip domain-containing protein [Loigolactobacillus zhaoyuanensis]|uniref:YhgE/Pip family protein n=2 Tax=Loigolactobacillus zhaoyuanensis TaxID=2486017 RepID=A0ABW8UB34_9LACO|nr:YhgE/Pip domain-containing protein [Loigolactobacillus zhaoyuanensis]